jgi:hypothetical protein
MTLAPLINEYGMIIIGFVGNAKNGCELTGGDFADSCGLCEPDFCPGVFEPDDGFCVVEFGGCL